MNSLPVLKMDVKEVIKGVSQLRVAVEAKKEEKHVDEVKLFVPMEALFSIADPTVSHVLRCKLMSADATQVLAQEMRARLCNLSVQRLDASHLSEDHEWRKNPPRVALLEVELSGGAHLTLAGRIAPVAEGECLVFAGKDADGNLVVYDIKDASFEEWHREMMGDPMIMLPKIFGEKPFGLDMVSEEHRSQDDEESKEMCV